MLASCTSRCLKAGRPVAGAPVRSRVCVRAGPSDAPEEVKSAMEDAGIKEPSREQAPARPPQNADESGLPSAITQTLTPRVAQLKRKQLSEGTTDPISAFILRAGLLALRCGHRVPAGLLACF